MKLKKLFICLIVVVSFLFNQHYASEVYTDQQLAQELKNAPMDISLASGWTPNGESRIFTTIYDQAGTYRGYRINQIFRDGIPNEHLKQLQKDAKNECNISEVSQKEFDYQGESKEGFEIICMQDVGNNGSATIKDNVVTINPNYGQEEGYLIGIQVPHYTFKEVKGGEVRDNILYITDNAGGSATLEALEPSAEEESTEPPPKSNLFTLLCILAATVLILIALIQKYLSIKKELNNINFYQQNHQNTSETCQYNPEQFDTFVQEPNIEIENNFISEEYNDVEQELEVEDNIDYEVLAKNGPDVDYQKLTQEEVVDEIQEPEIEEEKEDRKSVIANINALLGKDDK